MQRQMQSPEWGRSRQSRHIHRLIIGLAVLLLVAAGTFLLPTGSATGGQEAGVVIEFIGSEMADSQPVPR